MSNDDSMFQSRKEHALLAARPATRIFLIAVCVYGDDVSESHNSCPIRREVITAVGRNQEDVINIRGKRGLTKSKV